MDAMALVITLVVSVCSMPKPDAIKAETARLAKANPGAKVNVRFDKKCLK